MLTLDPPKNLLALEDLKSGIDLKPLLSGFDRWALEIGCGKGLFLSQWAQRDPHRGHLALEVKQKRAQKTAGLCQEKGLRNTCVLTGFMEIFFKLIPENFRFEAIHLNFPDPWPKKRHARRRLIRLEALKLYGQHLKAGGRVAFVTDDFFLALEGQKNFREFGFIDVFEGIRRHWPCYPPSFYEQKYRARGRQIYYQLHAKKVAR